MEEQSQDIIFNSLRNAGVPIPSGIATIPDLTPESLFSICSHSISIIDQSQSLPSSLPEDSVADRYKICSDLTTAFKSLGYVGDISFHKFLYPSEEDLQKLVRFLVGRLAVCNEAKKESDEKETGEKVFSSAKEVKHQVQATNSAKLKSKNDFVGEFNQSESNQREDESSNCERALSTDLAMKNSELQHLQEEYDLLKTVVEMGLDEEHIDNLYIQQLNNRLGTKTEALTNLESHWSDLMMPLEAKKRSLLDALFSRKSMSPEKHKKKLEMKQEIESFLAETENRKAELIALRLDLKKQPNVTSSRHSFVQRIKEITKNSRKLDTDIERISKDIRELQLESNSIQERLDRNYALVNETMLREARKGPVGREANNILTGIHRSFERTAEAVLITDRTKREVTDYEAKYATLVSRSINIEKLQADLDSIRNENDILEQRL